MTGGVSPVRDEAGSEPLAGSDTEEQELAAPQESERHGRRRKRLSFWLELPILFVVALAFAVLIKTFAFQVFRIPSGSMTPTLAVGDRVVVNKVTYSPGNLHRGDIIVFVDPAQRGTPDPRNFVEKARDGVFEALGGEGRNRHLIKRVIACPGQTVEGRAGQIFVDGDRISEPYIPEAVHTQWDGKVQLGPGEFFVMGDNRSNSADSRVFGPVREGEIVGRAALRIWPLSRVGGLPGGQGTC